MQTIVYYEVNFLEGLMNKQMMEIKNFLLWNDAVMYMNKILDEVIEKSAESGRNETVISDTSRKNPFELYLSERRQIVIKVDKTLCNIYQGAVIKKKLIIN